MLCNGVTMYFPSANYLLKCLQLSADATRDGGVVIYGDIQSRRHVLSFRAHVETYHALRRQDATALAVLNAAKQSVVNEELSYFDDELFHRLERNSQLFNQRLAKVEMRIKRGWWHSEFSRFRYDVWLVLKDSECIDSATSENESERPLKFQRVCYKSFCQELKLRDGDGVNDLVDPELVEKLEEWLRDYLLKARSNGALITMQDLVHWNTESGNQNIYHQSNILSL